MYKYGVRDEGYLLRSWSATLNEIMVGTPTTTFLPRETDANGKSGSPTDTLHVASALKKVESVLCFIALCFMKLYVTLQ